MHGLSDTGCFLSFHLPKQVTAGLSQVGPSGRVAGWSDGLVSCCSELAQAFGRGELLQPGLISNNSMLCDKERQSPWN